MADIRIIAAPPSPTPTTHNQTYINRGGWGKRILKVSIAEEFGTHGKENASWM